MRQIKGWKRLAVILMVAAMCLQNVIVYAEGPDAVTSVSNNAVPADNESAYTNVTNEKFVWVDTSQTPVTDIKSTAVNTSQTSVAPDNIKTDSVSTGNLNTDQVNPMSVTVPEEVKVFMDAVIKLPTADQVMADNAKEIGNILNSEKVSDGYALASNIGEDAGWLTDEIKAACVKYEALFQAVESVLNLGSSTYNEPITNNGNWPINCYVYAPRGEFYPTDGTHICVQKWNFNNIKHPYNYYNHLKYFYDKRGYKQFAQYMPYAEYAADNYSQFEQCFDFIDRDVFMPVVVEPRIVKAGQKTVFSYCPPLLSDSRYNGYQPPSVYLYDVVDVTEGEEYIDGGRNALHFYASEPRGTNPHISMSTPVKADVPDKSVIKIRFRLAYGYEDAFWGNALGFDPNKNLSIWTADLAEHRVDNYFWYVEDFVYTLVVDNPVGPAGDNIGNAYVAVQCSDNADHKEGGDNVSEYSLKDNPDGWTASALMLTDSSDEPFYSNGIEWKCVLTLDNKYWADKYDSIDHVLDSSKTEPITITAYYNNGKWLFDRQDVVKTVYVKDAVPTAPTKDEVAEILKGSHRVNVICTNDNRTHTLHESYYDITADDITFIGQPYKQNDTWVVQIGSVSNKFVDKFIADTGNVDHTEVSGGFTVLLFWDGNEWISEFMGFMKQIKTTCAETHTVTVRYLCDENNNPFNDKVTYSYELEKGQAYNHSIDQNNTTYPLVSDFNPNARSPKSFIVGTSNWVFDQMRNTDALKGTMGDDDIVLNVYYSRDKKGTIGNDPDTGEVTDTSDGLPDKYQINVTFKVKNGSWDNGSASDVIKYITKYGDNGMDFNGKATLGNIIPAVGNCPDPDYKSGNWDVTPTKETKITEDTIYTYIYEHDHSWDAGSVETEPDCIHDGTRILTCTICNTTKIETIDKLDHDFTTGSVIDNCDSGMDKNCTGHTLVCGRCGDNAKLDGYQKTEPHTFGDWVEEGGIKRRICNLCGHMEEQTGTVSGNVLITVKYIDEQNNEVGTAKMVSVPKDSEYDMSEQIEIPKGYIANGKPAGDPVKGTADTDKIIIISVKQLKYVVTYTDGVDGETVFKNQVTKNLTYGSKTPTFNGTPKRTDYEFTGWSPAVSDTVTSNVMYVAQWKIENKKSDDKISDNRKSDNKMSKSQKSDSLKSDKQASVKPAAGTSTKSVSRNAMETVKTGDGSNPGLWLLLAVVSVMGIVFVTIAEKKQKDDK